MYTKFEVSSLNRSIDILRRLKVKMGYVTWQCPFRGHFVIRRLGLAIFNPHIKFEMSTITCNEEMKGHAKCKIFRFETPFGPAFVAGVRLGPGASVYQRIISNDCYAHDEQGVNPGQVGGFDGVLYKL